MIQRPISINILCIHPENPQDRLIERVIPYLESGGVIAYPTDSGYALGCKMGQKSALKSIENIREFDQTHHYTLLCRDLSEIAQYAHVENAIYRLLKRCTPGAYTFILPASSKVPKLTAHPKKKTIGIRISSHPVPQAIISKWGQPLCSTSLILPGQDEPLHDPEQIKSAVSGVDVLIDSGETTYEATTIIDLTEAIPKLIREGAGDISWMN